MAAKVMSTANIYGRLFLIILGFFCFVMPVSAFSQIIILGGSAEHISYEGGAGTLWLNGYGIGSWRTAFEDGGYTAIDGYANIAVSPEGDGLVQDDESLTATLGLEVPGGMWESTAGLDASIDDITYGMVLRPNWSSRYTFSQDTVKSSRTELEPYLEYSGYSLSQEQGPQDRLSHTAALGLSYDPSIKRGYRMEISGNTTQWGDDYTDYLSSETVLRSDEHRQDVTASGELEITGLAGYFADWGITLSGGATHTNDQVYLAEGDMKRYGNDVAFGGIDGEFSWSPKRELGISSLLYGEGRHYFDRRAEKEDGTLGTEALTAIDIGGRLKFDFIQKDNSSFILELSGGRTISNDPSVDTWKFSVSGGIEFGL